MQITICLKNSEDIWDFFMVYIDFRTDEKMIGLMVFILINI